MELNYKTYGQGDPLIILHGLFGMLDNWQTLGKKFAEDFTVFLVDQRNHGRSPHVEEHTYPLMAADLKQFMEQQWTYQSHLLGHSMGGKTVMQFALDYPDMVDKLIVVDIAPKQYPERHNKIFDALRTLNPEAIDDRETLQSSLEEKIEDKGVVLFLMKNLTRKKQGGFQFKMNLEALYNNYQKVLAPIRSNHTFDGETLFIRGENSSHVAATDESDIKELFPNVRIEVIEEAGHWVHAEKPDELYRIVSEFLKN